LPTSKIHPAQQLCFPSTLTLATNFCTVQSFQEMKYLRVFVLEPNKLL